MLYFTGPFPNVITLLRSISVRTVSIKLTIIVTLGPIYMAIIPRREWQFWPWRSYGDKDCIILIYKYIYTTTFIKGSSCTHYVAALYKKNLPWYTIILAESIYLSKWGEISGI